MGPLPAVECRPHRRLQLEPLHMPNSPVQFGKEAQLPNPKPRTSPSLLGQQLGLPSSPLTLAMPMRRQMSVPLPAEHSSYLGGSSLKGYYGSPGSTPTPTSVNPAFRSISQELEGGLSDEEVPAMQRKRGMSLSVESGSSASSSSLAGILPPPVFGRGCVGGPGSSSGTPKGLTGLQLPARVPEFTRSVSLPGDYMHDRARQRAGSRGAAAAARRTIAECTFFDSAQAEEMMMMQPPRPRGLSIGEPPDYDISPFPGGQAALAPFLSSSFSSSAGSAASMPPISPQSLLLGSSGSSNPFSSTCPPAPTSLRGGTGFPPASSPSAHPQGNPFSYGSLEPPAPSRSPRGLGEPLERSDSAGLHKRSSPKGLEGRFVLPEGGGGGFPPRSPRLDARAPLPTAASAPDFSAPARSPKLAEGATLPARSPLADVLRGVRDGEEGGPDTGGEACGLPIQLRRRKGMALRLALNSTPEDAPPEEDLRQPRLSSLSLNGGKPDRAARRNDRLLSRRLEEARGANSGSFRFGLWGSSSSSSSSAAATSTASAGVAASASAAPAAADGEAPEAPAEALRQHALRQQQQQQQEQQQHLSASGGSVQCGSSSSTLLTWSAGAAATAAEASALATDATLPAHLAQVCVGSGSSSSSTTPLPPPPPRLRDDAAGRKLSNPQTGSASVSNLCNAATKWCQDMKRQGQAAKNPDGSAGAPAPAPAPSPETIEWRKGEQVGRGTFGAVFMGLNARTGELFAVKQIPLVDGTQEEVGRLEREITLMRRLDHPNIVRYLGTAHDPENLFIFMEYIPGGSIASMLAQFGVFSEDLIRRMVAQIVRGIHYLHSMGIVHRDIKGANVLVSDFGVAKLADFGCSRQLHGIQSASLGDSFKAVTGSVPWMAPEVIKQTGQVPFAADIWSIGATVIEMATASRPWPQHTNQLATLFHVATCTEPPPFPTNLTEACEGFLSRCLVVDEASRASSAELLAHPFIAAEVEEAAATGFVPGTKVAPQKLLQRIALAPAAAGLLDEQGGQHRAAADG